ncbi:MAG: Rrf2 family transcriptional regulator [Pirellulales bacterium]
MIPQTAEYALRAVVWLAGQGTAARTSDQIATATQVPPRYLYKVLQMLTQAGLAHSQPGPRGGYSLARTPRKITILEVINAVAPIERIESCPLKLKSHATTLCALHHELDQAYAHIEKAFQRVTVAQLLRGDSSVTPLCDA